MQEQATDLTGGKRRRQALSREGKQLRATGYLIQGTCPGWLPLQKLLFPWPTKKLSSRIYWNAAGYMAREIKVKRAGDLLKIVLPSDAMYVVLVAGED